MRNKTDTSAPAPETIDPLSRNIHNITGLRAKSEQQVNPHQKMVERVTLWLGRPKFLYGILVVVTAWITLNLAVSHAGFRSPDPPPFYWMQGLVSLVALLMTTVVLITQNRLAKTEEQRDHLELQINLLAEQRTAKIVDLLEELRRDMPLVPSRVDLEAEALKETVDPHVVLTALEFKMEQAIEGDSPESLLGKEGSGTPSGSSKASSES